MKKLLILLSILFFTNFAFADTKEDTTKKSFYDFQTYLLNEFISIASNIENPNNKIIDMFTNCLNNSPFIWDEIKEHEVMKFHFESKKSVKSLNQDAKSYLKLIQTEEGQAAIETFFMEIISGALTEPPKPFQKIQMANFRYIMQQSMFYGLGCD